jgi:LuxR family maltose regulon positive regulatory protein
LNELGQTRRELIFLLDDYHVIEDLVIHESIRFFIDHLFPTLHVVLATRADPELPLSRWRMRDEMIEIRTGDLRFTQVEAQSYLSQRMGLSLSSEDIATLVHRTEGWIAGLQLAALAMRQQPDPARFVQDVAGSYRYLLDYVHQDILAQLPDSLQRFLLETSVVSRMNADLCQAVTGGPSLQDSQEILEELERANLFVVPLDEQRQWYRYHDLFREVLRARLHATQPEQVPLLHIRAARWYETQAEWREAVAHALAAPDYPLAASLMEQAAPHLWRSGEASTVQNWALTLPDSVLRAHARLVFNAALRFLNSVHMSTETVHASMAAQVERTIARMEAILRSEHSPTLSEAETAFIQRRVGLLRASGRLAGMRHKRNGEKPSRTRWPRQTTPWPHP